MITSRGQPFPSSREPLGLQDPDSATVGQALHEVDGLGKGTSEDGHQEP